MTIDADMIGGMVLLVMILLIGGVLIYFFQFRTKEGKVVIDPSKPLPTETLSDYVEKAVSITVNRPTPAGSNLYTTSTTMTTQEPQQ